MSGQRSGDPGDSPRLQVVGLGFCAFDRLFTVETFPPLGGKRRILREHTQGGGQVATALVALSRLGIRGRFIGKRGDDPEGEQIERELREAGIDLTGLIAVPGARSQRAYIVVPESGDAAGRGAGERSIFWQREAAIDLKASDLERNWLPRHPYLLLLDGHEMEACLKAARHCREQGGRVVLDAEYAHPDTPGLLGYVDDLVTDAGFPAKLLGKRAGDRPDHRDTLERLRALGPHRVVVTLGARGAVHWDGWREIRVPAFDVPVVDSTGAGDVFHAGYCYALLHEMAPEDGLRFACAMAGLKCRAPGGRLGIPDLEEIETLLSTGRIREND